MSVAQNFGKLFNRTPAATVDGALSGEQGAAGPVMSDPLREHYPGDALNSVQGSPDPADVELPESSIDRISLPLLGEATAAEHQRRLLMLLALGVVLLALIAGWGHGDVSRLRK